LSPFRRTQSLFYEAYSLFLYKESNEDYSEADGLGNDNIYAIDVDQYGDIWIGTVAGIIFVLNISITRMMQVL